MKHLFLLCFIALISIIGCTRPDVDSFYVTNFGTDTACPRFGKGGIKVTRNATISIKYKNAYMENLHGITQYDSFSYPFTPGLYEFCDCNGSVTATEGALPGYQNFGIQYVEHF
jgi:hypothetical protein